jgi:hypothetical protein
MTSGSLVRPDPPGSTRERQAAASFVSRHRLLVRYAAAVVLFCVGFAVWFHGVALHPGSRVPCCLGDGTSSIRDFWVMSHLHKTPWTFTLDTMNGAPQGKPRAPATLVANSGLQTTFVWYLRGVIGVVGAWNLYLFLGLIGTSVATFALLDWLGCAFAASLFAGYAFGFSPYAFEHAYIGHLAFVQNWVFVLTTAAMLRVRDRRSYGAAALAGGSIATAFYVSAYEGLFVGVIAAVFYLADLIRLHGRSERVRTLALASASFWTTFVALVPMLLLYRDERSIVDATTSRPVGDLYVFAAKFGAYLVPSPRNPLFHWTRSLHPSDLTGQTLFFGYTVMAFAVVAYVLIYRRDAWLRAAEIRWGTAISMAALTPVALLLSLPPSYHFGRVLVPMPSALVGGVTTFWRTYSRLGSVVGFALAVLAALTLTSVSRRPGRVWRLLPALALSVAVLELLPGNVGVFDTSPSAAPGWVSWLATQPRGTYATYPMTRGRGAPDELASEAFFFQTVDRDPSFVNFAQSSGEFASRNESIRLLAYDLRDPLAARVLATEGVRYVVVVPAAYRAIGQGVPTLATRDFTLLRRTGDASVYTVHAPHLDLSRAIRSNRGRLRRLRALD